jgi:hypothetical protein
VRFFAIEHNGPRVWLESVGGDSRADNLEITAELFGWHPAWRNFCTNMKRLK